jgi:hypothetical protein
MIHRYSSRRNPLKDFLATRLQGARRYDRIAGFFSSSLLEVAGEALELVKTILTYKLLLHILPPKKSNALSILAGSE